MISFRNIKWRNFLSTGNEETSIQLDRSPTTLIVGQNGAGKSTLLDALSFALFGKPHRNINKPQLVNSINNKNCEVEVSFDIGKHKFVVKRGIKPAKFEIWQNGNMINQSSAAKDYQNFLEQNILKLNHKSFHQIVVLGSSSFIPFMQLPTPHRRDVIEDLLDIQIFSKMGQLLKEKDGKIKESINGLNYEIDLTKEKTTLQQKYIRDITEMNDEQILRKEEQMTDNNVEIKEIESLNKILEEKNVKLQKELGNNLQKAQEKRQKLVEFKAQFNSQIKGVVKEAKFYEDNENCPTCEQDIEDQLRKTKLESAKAKAFELNEGISRVNTELEYADTSIDLLTSTSNSIVSNTNEISKNNASITSLQKQNTSISNEIQSLRGSTGDLSKANNEYRELVEAGETLLNNKNSLSSERLYLSVAGEMLKDTGIKTKVVKQYLPVMNTLINKYLQVLDFFVSFNLDESFSETIKSRHRDNFNYASFSEGEKQRIDLALLFTWRQIARMKNSTSTNLLVLDETFDSSLDHDGVENLMKILNTLDNNTNVFVISHKGDLLDGKFRNKITFKKEHNFSKMLLTGE
jgi:DNA repair exonuclease SbcCD ATPase subunit